MANKAEPKLHYNKNAVVAEYERTFGVFMTTLLVGIGGALVYFLVFVVYLGGWSHTHSDDFVRTFGSRIELDYAGQKLPMFTDPAKADAFHATRPLNQSEPQPATTE